MRAGPFAVSLTAGAGVSLVMGQRIAVNSSFEPVAAGAAQRFLGTLLSDINGDNHSNRTGGLQEVNSGIHYAIYASATALAKGDAIQGAALGRVDKWGAVATVTALPAANASVSATGYDLGTDLVPGVQLQLTVPTLPALVADKTVTFQFEDSADNAAFAKITSIPNFVLTGAAPAASAVTHVLPANVRRYVRVTATVLAAGGDNTAVSFTMNILLPKIGTAFEAAAAAGDVIRVVFN